MVEQKQQLEGDLIKAFLFDATIRQENIDTTNEKIVVQPKTNQEPTTAILPINFGRYDSNGKFISYSAYIWLLDHLNTGVKEFAVGIQRRKMQDDYSEITYITFTATEEDTETFAFKQEFWSNLN